MMRYSIRDSRSRKKTKPRIFDVIVEDNGEMEEEAIMNLMDELMADYEKNIAMFDENEEAAVS